MPYFDATGNFLHETTDFKTTIKHVKKRPLRMFIKLASHILKRTVKPFLILVLLLTLVVCLIYLQYRSDESATILIAASFAGDNIQQTTGRVNISISSDTNSIIEQAISNDKELVRPTEDYVIKNYPNYYEDNLHLNWTFKISRHYDEKHLRNWTEPPRIVIKSWEQGKNGKGFLTEFLSESEQKVMKKLAKKHEYNILATEKISLRRTLLDYRFPECKSLSYPEQLPATSIIIVFHNEAWSTILRTIWSIVDRSPAELVHEIIMVDDASTWSFLKQPLDDYIQKIAANIRIIRSDERQGLIRARLIGARNATGSILTFLDAHTECTEGWLPPIMARIANDRSVVAVPKIDGINAYDFGYNIDKMEINAIRWSLLFNMADVPRRELVRTKYDKTAPIRTPTHVGCAFAIDREFFFEMGSYDEEMDIWGSENIELAFRVWMCGGSLEVLPCSRIGHLYRLSTYSFNGNGDLIKARNNVRVVEVWMDEFKDFFYAANPRSQNVLPGDLTKRKHLRKQLNCKSFRWYLDNIYPETYMLKEYISMGEVRSVPRNMCLDIYGANLGGKIILYRCLGNGGFQFLAFAKDGHIVTVYGEELCVGIYDRLVVLVQCNEYEQDQLWIYDAEKQWIIHKETQLCVQYIENGVVLDVCDSTDDRCRWELRPAIPKDNYN